jgi:hypothetical protein
MSKNGFIKLHREGLELIEASPSAFLLLALIAFRARRTGSTYSTHKLKMNEAVIGDHETIGLTRQQYRGAMEKLEKYGLAVFKRDKRGTIATLVSTAIFDINAESEEEALTDKQPFQNPLGAIQQPTDNRKATMLEPSEQPSDLSIENRREQPSEQPTRNHQATTREPERNQFATTGQPLTKKEEKEEERAAAAFSHTIFKCLDGLDLSDQEKRSLMRYGENRVAHAVEFVKRKQDVDSVIGMLTWVCQQPELPELPREKRKNLTPQQKLALEYNRFLESNGYPALAKQNEETIPNDRMMILELGRPMSIVLNHSLLTLQDDFGKSKDEILKSQRIVRDLQGDKLSPVR